MTYELLDCNGSNNGMMFTNVDTICIENGIVKFYNKTELVGSYNSSFNYVLHKLSDERTT